MALTPDTLPTRDQILALVPVATMKTELGIENTVFDESIADKIVEAYFWFDGPTGWLNRSILTQRWSLTLPCLSAQSGWSVELPLPPFRSIVSFQYRDVDGAWITVPGDAYEAETPKLHGAITKAFGQSWPSTGQFKTQARLVYEAGYGDANAVRAQAAGIIRAIKVLAAEYYWHRAASDDGEGKSVSKRAMYGIEHSAGRYRIANDHS